MKRFFRGPLDVILLGLAVLTVASMLFALGVVHGRTQQRLAHERSCGDRFECAAQTLKYVRVR